LEKILSTVIAKKKLKSLILQGQHMENIFAINIFLPSVLSFPSVPSVLSFPSVPLLPSVPSVENVPLARFLIYGNRVKRKYYLRKYFH
jgi:hypothetical protein